MGKVIVVGLMLAMVSLVDCGIGGGGGCGVAPEDGPNVENGTVTFDRVALGSSEVLSIPVADTDSSVSETITGATLSGHDAAAFAVITSFPLDIPKGASKVVQIRFTPTHAGESSATLVLQTAGMGPSPVPVVGTAFTPGF